MIVGLIGGWLTDTVVQRLAATFDDGCDRLDIHHQAECECFVRHRIVPQLQDLSAARGVLLGALILLAFALLTGTVGPAEWNWVRVTILGVTLSAVFIAGTVPEHFLQEHLWKHIVRGHIPRVFLWTLGALVVTWGITEYVNIETFIRDRPLEVIVVSALVGLIPESGPHLLFVTLYAKGVVPFTVLLTSSIVQDGHGMLPLLAQSRRAFIMVKSINLAVGILVGVALYFVGTLL
jgi:hypothetical protein